MYLRTLSQTLKASMAFLLLPLLAVMSLSLANSAPPANNSVEITFSNIVDLPHGDMARKGKVLVLGTNCADLIGLPQQKQINMPWMGQGMRLHLYHIPGNIPIDQMVEQINNSGLDCVASPNYLTYLSGHSMWGSPHDGYGANASIPDIKAQPALSMVHPFDNVTGPGVTVAMFDSYCQESQGNEEQGTSKDHVQDSGFGSIDYQGNYTKRIPARFHSPGPRPNLCGHGEGVASILRTIAPDANIKLYRVLGNNGFGTLWGLLEAINDFAQSQPLAHSVINLSLGVKGDSPILERVLNAAHQEGVVIVAAAGNQEQGARTQYPAAYSFVMAVAASDGDGNLASYANVGDVLAPGGQGDCKSSRPTDPNNCLTVLNSRARSGAVYWKGSSFSAGMVSGLAALLFDAGSTLSSTLSSTDVETLIQDGANPSNNVLDIDHSLNLCVTRGQCPP